MFNGSAPVPVVQVSIPTDLRPETQHALGVALAPLRKEGVLVISGGLTIHTFRDFSAFSPDTAKPQYRSWEKSIVDAVAVEEVSSIRPSARCARAPPDPLLLPPRSPPLVTKLCSTSCITQLSCVPLSLSRTPAAVQQKLTRSPTRSEPLTLAKSISSLFTSRRAQGPQAARLRERGWCAGCGERRPLSLACSSLCATSSLARSSSTRALRDGD